MESLITSVSGRLPRQIRSADLFLLVSAVPILFMLALAPQTFGLSWAGFGKLGRGGLLFVLFFLGFELMDFRKSATSRMSRSRQIAVATLLIIALVYFGGVAAIGQFTDFVYSVGRTLGASGEFSNSWLMAMDYLALGLYTVALASVFFGVRAIKGILTAVVFSAGMLVMYLLDAFFPYGSIGPLQFWANFIVAGVGLLSKAFGLPISGFSNHLNILGKHGTFRLIVYWPSVGVHSMLIYSLVMVLLAVKLSAPAKRKIVYIAGGVAGTILLNVLRIFIISYYGYLYATSAGDLDAFHNSIGEFLFPIWILAFLLIVLNIEGRLSARARRVTVATSAPSVTTLDHETRRPPQLTTKHLRE